MKQTLILLRARTCAWIALTLALSLQGCHRPQLEAFVKKESAYPIAILPGEPVAISNFRGTLDVHGDPKAKPLIQAHSVAGARNPEEAQLRLDQIGLVRLPPGNQSGTAYAMVTPNAKVRGLRSDLLATIPPDSHVSLQTNEGQIHVEDLQNGLSVTVREGGIVLDRITGNLNAQTSRGGILARHLTLKNAPAPHLFSSRNGTIRLEIDKADGPIEVRTRYQPIEISLPPGTGYHFQLFAKKGVSTVAGPNGVLAQSEKGKPLTHALPGTRPIPVVVTNHKAPIRILLRK